jgi:hypothetical protein
MAEKKKARLKGEPIPNAVLADASEHTKFPLNCKKKGGRASRDKGNRAERAIVKFLQERGFAAERVPLSGSAGGSYLGDLTVPILNVDRVVEVKCRGTGFKQLYDWLVDRDILIVRADRSEPLVVLPLKLAAEIAAKAAGHE